MSDVVIYAARPERVLAVASQLESHGLACRIVWGAAMAFPWVLAGVPRHQIVVDDAVAEEAHRILQALHSVEDVSAKEITRSVHGPLIAMALSFVGIVASGMAFTQPGLEIFMLGVPGGLVVLIVAFVQLRKATGAPHSRAVPREP